MKRALATTFALAAIAAVVSDAGAAPCGPTYCPSYTTCRVGPVAKANPAFSELSTLFDEIAPGPSKYGTLGWSYSLKLGDGIGKPHPAEKVDARYPCVLLKAISVQESVGWHQFCVPTTPTCTGVSQTIISFDCGFGLMQVTSGMRSGETSAYDPNRVASDAAYNVSVGSQILGGKWTVTPSVGDNRVDVIEDWYIAVWAYNGLAFSNNPNNPAYPADRKPYRDPGGLSAGNYPYQELIWGYMRVPIKDSAGALGYKGYALSYPNRSEFCSSCGSPSAGISDPSPTHLTDCPGSGPPPTTVATFELRPANDAKERFADGTSKGIADVLEGDGYVADLVIQNTGDVSAPPVVLGVDIEEPFVTAVKYTIESDAGHPGTFAVNDANDRPDNPKHDSPGASLTLNMNAFGAKETKRVHLEMKATRYSIGAADHPDVRYWVKSVPGVYTKDTFDAKPTDTSGAQKFNGGDLKAWTQVDVFSRVQWSFDGGTLEGWAPSGAADAVINADKTMTISAKGDDPIAIGPDTEIDAATYGAVKVRAKSPFSSAARLYFATKDAPAFAESRAIDFTVPSDGAMHDVVVDLHDHPDWKGTITKLRLDPVTKGTGDFVVDDVRLTTPTGAPVPIDGGVDDGGMNDLQSDGSSGGCGCFVAGERSTRGGLLVALGALAAALSGRRWRAGGRSARARRARR